MKLILQFWVTNPYYELHRDEYLYLDQSNHLAAGYISIPPLLSWLGMIPKTLGYSLFTVRLIPALCGSATIFFCWKISEYLGGRLVVRILIALTLLFSVFLRTDILFQPTSFDIMAWTAIYCWLIRYFIFKKPQDLLILGLIAGISVLNKYNVFFLFMGLIPALFISGSWKIFKTKYTLYAMMISLLIILPNIIWQFSHHFPVFFHMKELRKTQLDHVERLGFLEDQAKFFMLGTLIIISAVLGSIFSKRLRPYRFIGLSYVFTILIFVWLRGKNYYALGLYPVLIAVGFIYLDQLFLFYRMQWVLPVFVFIHLCLFLLLIPLVLPLKSPAQIIEKPSMFRKLGLLKWEDGKDHELPQDFADMTGWKELASKTFAVYQSLSEQERRQTLIITDNYGQAGAINYYEGKLMNHAVSFNADYMRWFPQYMIKTVIAVKTNGNGFEPAFSKFFTYQYKADSVTNQYSREYHSSVWLIRAANDSFTHVLDSAIQQRMQYE